MINSYQSIYVAVYRWIFKNFGQGKLPQVKSVFNASFLLIILLTIALVGMEFTLRYQLFNINAGQAVTMLLGIVFFMFLNYFVLLNNRWVKKLNERINILGRHDKNVWSVLLLVNVVIVCVFSMLIAK